MYYDDWNQNSWIYSTEHLFDFTIVPDNPGPNPDDGSKTCLIVWQSETRKDYYLLREKPKVTMNNGDFILTTTSTTIAYPFDNIWKFTLADNDSDPSGIKDLKAVAGPALERQSDKVILTGEVANSPIYIYKVDGQLVKALRTDNNGQAEVSISDLPAGVYVVRTNGVTIKITKR